MMEIVSNKQLASITKKDSVLIKKSPSKHMLHRGGCISLDIARHIADKENRGLTKKYEDFGVPFPRNSKYYHIKSDEHKDFSKYKDRQCSKCFSKN